MTYVYIIYEKNLPHVFIMTLKWENVFKACKTCKESGYIISFPLQKKSKTQIVTRTQEENEHSICPASLLLTKELSFLGPQPSK